MWSRRVLCRRSSSSSSSSTRTVQVFDRALKRRQRDWSLGLVEGDYYDYLRVESASRLCDRLEDIKRSFPLTLDLGCHRGHIYKVVSSAEGLQGRGGIGGIETLVQCDFSDKAVELRTLEGAGEAAGAVGTGGGDGAVGAVGAEGASSPTPPRVKQFVVHCDEEALPFKEHSFDAVLSSMSLHWVNDLPSTLQQIKRVLKPDGAFVASMLGGSTLQELRYCFYLAEQERRGGLSSHTSPFALPSDVAGLMQGAGFSLPTIDVDTVTLSYPDAFTLMEHLVNMGEGTASLSRQFAVGKDTFLAAAALYQELYGLEDGSVTATFQIIYMIGWSPHESQPKACQRGSGTAKIGAIREKV